MIASWKAGLLVVCGGLVVAGLGGRACSSGGSNVGHREMVRTLACGLCGTVSLVDTDTIRRQYDGGQVKAGPRGALFTCPSCDGAGAAAVVLNFENTVFACETCGGGLLSGPGEAEKAVRAGKVQSDETHHLRAFCKKCDAYSRSAAQPGAPAEGP